MGLFDFFLSDEKKIQKHAKRMQNRDAQPEDRELSAQWLSDNGSPQALVGLLSRFDMKLDHQMKDQTEKDFTYALLLSHGESAVEPAKAWLRRAKSFALPLRLLGDLAGRDAAVDMVFELLAAETDPFKPNKKKDLLLWLADVRDPRCLERVGQYLEDFDEGVRYAAVEVLVAQEAPEVERMLLDALVSEKEDSNRVRCRIAEVVASRRYSLPEAHQTYLVEQAPPGYTVAGERLIPA